jgi:hypothetical protein
MLIEDGTEYSSSRTCSGPMPIKTINLLRRSHSSALFRQQVLFTYPTYGSDIRFMV